MLVEAFVGQPSVEGFNVNVLARLSRLDQAQDKSLFVSPGHHRLAAKLLNAMCSDHSWPAALYGQSIQHSGPTLPGNRLLHFDDQSLKGGVVNDAQALGHPAFCGAVDHQLHRPYLIGSGTAAGGAAGRLLAPSWAVAEAPAGPPPGTSPLLACNYLQVLSASASEVQCLSRSTCAAAPAQQSAHAAQN